MALSKTALPKSALGQAAAYTLNMWAKLRRCFDYAEVELSNNLAENSMRPIALGRKNWLHVGSAQAETRCKVQDGLRELPWAGCRA
jgi:transposase